MSMTAAQHRAYLIASWITQLAPQVPATDLANWTKDAPMIMGGLMIKKRIGSTEYSAYQTADSSAKDENLCVAEACAVISQMPLTAMKIFADIVFPNWRKNEYGEGNQPPMEWRDIETIRNVWLDKMNDALLGYLEPEGLTGLSPATSEATQYEWA